MSVCTVATSPVQVSPSHTHSPRCSQTQLRKKLLWPSQCSNFSTITDWFTSCLSPSHSLRRGKIPGHAQGNVISNVTSSALEPKCLSLPNKSPRWMQRRRRATILSFPYSKWFVTCECRTEEAQQDLSEGNMPWIPRNTVLLHCFIFVQASLTVQSRFLFFYHNLPFSIDCATIRS